MIAALLLFILTTFYFMFNYESKKYGFVNYPKVFEEFNMYKEINSKGIVAVETRKEHLDSLYIAHERTSDNKLKTKLMKLIIIAKQELEYFGSNYMNEQSQSINERIRSYGADYIRENNYKIIFGMQPDMGIISGDDDSDLTNEFIIYINKKYEGNK